MENGMIDAYLRIGDIKGESQDEKHKQWIEVGHVNWGVTQPRASRKRHGFQLPPE
jgi:type VI secretion system secreted protein Hcp